LLDMRITVYSSPLIPLVVINNHILVVIRRYALEILILILGILA
jgi:hypothetical protein